jgi:hypothetical protein
MVGLESEKTGVKDEKQTLILRFQLFVVSLWPK